MEIIQSFVTQNPMYRNPRRIPIKKLVLHSVGCPQPSAAVFARLWQSARYFAHAVLQADGKVYQCMPWDYLVYHVGAANAYSVGVEMTEPDCIRYTGGATFVCSNLDRAAEQISGTYNTAVELFAELCNQFGLDPYSDIISHNEASKMGIGTDHVDPEHLWKQLNLGYTMDGFRQDVYNKIHGANNEEEEEDMIRYNTIDEVPSWAQPTIRAMIDSGALKGDQNGNLNLSMDMIRGLMIGKAYSESVNPKYETIDDVPSWAKEEVKKLIDRGALAGTGDGKIDLSLDTLRSILIMQRVIDEK